DPKGGVPLDLSLADEEKIVMISVPNAGGKSVCLKTVGLLQYMLQCGLLVSMREDSEAGVVRDIFVDIGDEQSIENDLSTYSSHLKNMKFWVEHADKNTLFLSDELGSGTEPQVGGAIAEALVEFLLRKGARGIITTHYTNLKLMAKNHPGIVNGAMLFDQENLRPLYVFRKGLPGSSFAFEIARKTGLPESVLAAAENKVGRRQLNFEQELQQIEVEKHVLHKKRQEVEVADDLLHSTLEKYRGLVRDLETHRTRLMNEAKAEARSLVKQANADIERTIREIREAQAEKEATRRARQVLNEKASEWEEKLPENEEEKPRKPAEEAKPNNIPLRVGMWVRMKDNPRTVGRIEKIQTGNARVNFDYMHMQLPFDKLVALTEKESLQYEKNLGRGSVKVENLSEGQLNFKPRIDLRGVRGEEAVEKTLHLVDQAVLYGEKHLEILHGKGNGILRQLIRGALSKNPHVQSFSDQEEQFGGSGITLVHLS
ncbi:MAG: Smr/MutS family protein, partial [Bacteroidales bacterium]|nr:Smr/MutS family protein [Bacteroidales bacterium]